MTLVSTLQHKSGRMDRPAQAQTQGQFSQSLSHHRGEAQSWAHLCGEIADHIDRVATPESREALLGRDAGEAVDNARVPRHFARDNLRVGVLRLDEELDALNRRRRGFCDGTGHATSAEVDEELSDTASLCRSGSSKLARGTDRLALIGQRMELAARDGVWSRSVKTPPAAMGAHRRPRRRTRWGAASRPPVAPGEKHGRHVKRRNRSGDMQEEILMP